MSKICSDQVPVAVNDGMVEIVRIFVYNTMRGDKGEQ